MVMQVYKSGHSTVVIERNATAQSNRPVTSEEMTKYIGSVRSAILSELKRWTDNSCLRRTPRAKAYNVISIIYVMV